MGRKVHPTGFRIGVIRDWQAKWYADRHYPEFIGEDVKLRQAIRSRYPEAGVSLVEIERQTHKVTVNIFTSRPGIVIGRGGQRVDETRHYLEDLIGKRVQLNIQEIRQPELDAYLVARVVAEQMERRIAYRRAMKQAIFRTMQAGAKGIRIGCSGRLGGVEIARRQTMHQGRVPLHTLRADIDYGFTEARTTLGRIGVKVWIYRGDILPELEEVVEEAAPEPAAEAEEVKPEAAAKAEVAAEKPAKPARKARAAKAREPATAEKEEAKAEKPVAPRAKRVTKAKPAAKEAKAEPAAPTTEKGEPVPAVTAVKPAKTRTRKRAEAKPEAAEKAEPKEPAAQAKETKKVTRKKPTKTEPAPEAKEIEEEKADAATEEG